MPPKTLLLLGSILMTTAADAAPIFSNTYNITGIGLSTGVIASTSFDAPSIQSIDFVEVALSNSYVSEFSLSLTTPTGDVFYLLSGNGHRTRVGAGDGTLAGTEVYRFMAPDGILGSVTDWNFTGYQAGGTYAAAEWPLGDWGEGTWMFSITNTNRSGFHDGVVGSVLVSATPIPEPSSSAVFAGLIILCSTRFIRRKTRI